MSSSIGSFGNSTTPRPTADAWCVYELDSNRNPIILDSVGVSSVTYISTGIFRVNFTNPERFASGAYVGLVQPELGNAQIGYGTNRVHGNPSDASPLAIGVSGSCDIHHMGFANIANIATQAQSYSDLSNSFKARTNAAFFCLRSDSDTRKPAVANFLPWSEAFSTRWSLSGNPTIVPAPATPANVNPFGVNEGVFFFYWQPRYQHLYFRGSWCTRSNLHILAVRKIKSHGRNPQFGLRWWGQQLWLCVQSAIRGGCFSSRWWTSGFKRTDTASRQRVESVVNGVQSPKHLRYSTTPVPTWWSEQHFLGVWRTG